MAEVGCAGILVADTFCGPMRELPREGQLLTVDSMPSKAGGCAANVAICLAKQGVEVDVVGCLGKDPAAKILLACFEEHRVGCEYVVYTDRYPTSTTVILLVEGQDRRYIHAFGANTAFTVTHVRRDWLMGLKVFYLGGLFAMPAVETGELFDLLTFCRMHGIITVVDVVVPQQFAGIGELKPLLPHIDYFLPNDDEARQITGQIDLFDQAHTFQDSGANTVIITHGRAGATAVRGGEVWRSGAYQMPVVDPTGPGDAFASGIITGILRGWDLPCTLRYASALGASATRAIGTTDGVFTSGEAESFIASHPLEVVCGSL
jgi:sugar/nucleoside kinase (ribokinase family)